MIFQKVPLNLLRRTITRSNMSDFSRKQSEELLNPLWNAAKKL